MPELPEIRVVAKALKSQIIKKKIKNVKILYPNIIVGDKEEFCKNLIGTEFKEVDTFGKWLIFKLGYYSFLSHLRMEGKYFYEKHDVPLEKHTHVVFELDNGMDLRYNDVRKFGRIELVKTKDIWKNPNISKLGIEPIDDTLSAEYLLGKFKRIKKPIKSVLLDQTIINGLGNIYANEVLFASCIDPFKMANEITLEEAERIIECSNKIITKSIEAGGSTIRSYTSSLGVIGHYQDYLLVHGKKEEPCSVCSNPIKKEKLDGRSVYFCEKCQK